MEKTNIQKMYLFIYEKYVIFYLFWFFEPISRAMWLYDDSSEKLFSNEKLKRKNEQILSVLLSEFLLFCFILFIDLLFNVFAFAIDVKILRKNIRIKKFNILKNNVGAVEYIHCFSAEGKILPQRVSSIWH